MSDFDWRRVKFRQTNAGLRAKSAAKGRTLGELDDIEDATMLRTPDLGRKTLAEIRRVIEAYRMAASEAEALRGPERIGERSLWDETEAVHRVLRRKVVIARNENGPYAIIDGVEWDIFGPAWAQLVKAATRG